MSIRAGCDSRQRGREFRVHHRPRRVARLAAPAQVGSRQYPTRGFLGRLQLRSCLPLFLARQTSGRADEGVFSNVIPINRSSLASSLEGKRNRRGMPGPTRRSPQVLAAWTSRVCLYRWRHSKDLAADIKRTSRQTGFPQPAKSAPIWSGPHLFDQF